MSYVSTGGAISVKVDWNIEFFLEAQLRCRPKYYYFYLLGYYYLGNENLVNQNPEEKCGFLHNNDDLHSNR